MFSYYMHLINMIDLCIIYILGQSFAQFETSTENYGQHKMGRRVVLHPPVHINMMYTYFIHICMNLELSFWIRCVCIYR
jgi:hypothetical protein